MHIETQAKSSFSMDFCPLLDASFMMLWRDMAYVEMYVNQD